MKKIIIIIISNIFLLCFVNFALAEMDSATGLKPPALQITIPDLSFSDNKGLWIGEYIQAIYNYAIGIVGILAAIVLMFGGLLWMTAGGETGRVSEAKEWIKASLLGLIIALSSYTILYIVNPDLITFKSLKIADINKVGISDINSTLIGPKIDMPEAELPDFAGSAPAASGPTNLSDLVGSNLTGVIDIPGFENVGYLVFDSNETESAETALIDIFATSDMFNSEYSFDFTNPEFNPNSNNLPTSRHEFSSLGIPDPDLAEFLSTEPPLDELPDFEIDDYFGRESAVVLSEEEKDRYAFFSEFTNTSNNQTFDILEISSKTEDGEEIRAYVTADGRAIIETYDSRGMTGFESGQFTQEWVGSNPIGEISNNQEYIEEKIKIFLRENGNLPIESNIEIVLPSE